MPRRILEGTVVSSKADKTVSVLVERRTMHPVYKKYIKNSKKFAAHDEQNHYKEGDRVRIIETRPISKSKTWAVLIGDEASMPTTGDKKATAANAKKPAAKKDEKKLAKPAEKEVKEQATKKSTAKKSTTAAKKAPAKKTAEKKSTAAKKTTAKKTTTKKDKK